MRPRTSEILSATASSQWNDRIATPVTRVIALVAAAAWLGIAEAGASLRAERITRENAVELLIGGPDAIGGVGDWYLANDVVEVIVDDPGRQHAKLNHGGTIVDAGLRNRKGDDQFARLFPVVNMDQRVLLNFDSMRAEVNRRKGWARLTVSSRQGLSAIARGGRRTFMAMMSTRSWLTTPALRYFRIGICRPSE